MAISELPDGSTIRERSRKLERTTTTAWLTGRAEWWLGLVVAVVFSSAYMWYFIDRGWIPHDDGSLAHSAERVLAGEMPHRDFIDGYTGGLTYINALAFKVFGIHLLAIRYALLVAFIAWIPLYYYVSAQFARPLGATVITLIAALWSVPNYPAAMPSWYNLFFATGGLAALFRYLATDRKRWLCVAGFLGGLSVLMKTHGILFIAAGLLFILYHESQSSAHPSDDRRTFGVLHLFPVAVLTVAVLALLAVGLSRVDLLDVYQFALPGLAMVAIVGRSVFAPDTRSLAAARGIIGSTVPYVVGAAVPLIAFAAYYAAADALPDLVRGIVSFPAKALVRASLAPSAPVALIPFALTAFVAVRLGDARRRLSILQNALGIAVIVLMLVPRTALTLEPLVWSSLAEATPVVGPLLAFLVVRSETRNGDSESRSRFVLVGCVAALCSLVQYPFAAAVYFAYSLPLLLLSVAAVLQAASFFRRSAVWGLACVYLVFGALYISPLKLEGLLGPVAADDIALLELPRAGLRVRRANAESYSVAVELLRMHGSSGVIYAGPDAPELYFLSGLKNPTRVLFDYLVPDTLFHQHLLQQLDSLGVNAVALRRHVVHSPPLEAEILDAFASKFPNAREVGNFTIRWR